MRNLNSHTSEQTSKDFYNQVLKSRAKNLNSSKTNNNLFENGLEKILNHSHQFLSPLFNEEENQYSFKEETESNNIDSDFDKHIENISPTWLKILVKLIIKIYHFIFPEKIKDFIHKKIQKRISKQVKNKLVNNNKTANNFFAFKPPT